MYWTQGLPAGVLSHCHRHIANLKPLWRINDQTWIDRRQFASIWLRHVLLGRRPITVDFLDQRLELCSFGIVQPSIL